MSEEKIGGAFSDAFNDAIDEKIDELAEQANEEAQEGTSELETVEQPVQEADIEVVEEEGSLSEEEPDAEYKARLRAYTRELKKLPGKWYIIQCYSGYENKVKTNLDMRAQTLEVEDSIYDVVVPVEQAIEIRDGKRKLVKRKLLPGYVLVRMDIDDRSWSVVRDTPGVTSFVGNEGNATPVKHRDVAKFLMPQETVDDSVTNAEGEKVVAMPTDSMKPKVAIDLEVGDSITILTGSFASFSATVHSIDVENKKLSALVSIFGRETPVELDLDQVEKNS